MVFLSFQELFDIAIMSLVVGFIFRDAFRPPANWHDPDEYLKNVTPGLRVSRLSHYWFAVLLVAPSIIVHEFGHKFTAMAFGLTAEFHAAYTWLAIGVLLKLILPGFVFFVPAYTSIVGSATAVQEAAISFAGPGVNLLFWLGSWFYLKVALRAGNRRRHGRETLRYLALFKNINMILFFLNMLPIPGFDGWAFYSSLYRAFF
jgi:hypothetical protein